MVLLASPAGRLRRATRGTRRAIAATSGSTRGERFARSPSISRATPVVAGPSAVDEDVSRSVGAQRIVEGPDAHVVAARAQLDPDGDHEAPPREAPDTAPSNRSTISRVTSAGARPTVSTRWWARA